METKQLTFLILILSFIIMLIALLNANIYLLALSETLLIPSIIFLYINNLNK